MHLHRWEHQGAQRYYQALVQENLLGEWEILRMWGGIGSARGGRQCVPVGGQAAARLALAETGRRRAKRGYLPVDIHGPAPAFKLRAPPTRASHRRAGSAITGAAPGAGLRPA